MADQDRPSADSPAQDQPSPGMVQAKELYLSHQPAQGNMVLLKRDDEATEYLLMFVGDAEFAAIAQEKGLLQVPRPLTHSTYLEIFKNAPIEFLRVEIYDQRDNAFIANVYVKENGRIRVIDSRPSDAVCLALRVEMPIYVNPKLLRGDDKAAESEVLREFTKKVKF
ncbi:MAG: bifunctional nuclease family protein [Proteobacteria bacterium]|nr:bifunctional nuclease family protein [Pseudomonadota bacterium]MBU1740189.1 bifunctional nuclease family protein [Pseudomonadota bacterium]